MFAYCARHTFNDMMGRQLLVGFGTVGALFLMLAFWWYCERLAPQLARELWPLVLFEVDATTEFGVDLVVHTLHNNSGPVYWPRRCKQDGHVNCNWRYLPPGLRLNLFQDPDDAMNLSDSNRIADEWAVVLAVMPTMASWIIAVGLNYIYTHESTVGHVAHDLWHYMRPPPVQAPPEGYVHRDPPNDPDTTSTSTSSEPPAYTLMDVPDEPAAMQ
jgi:hypothetical protein